MMTKPLMLLFAVLIAFATFAAHAKEAKRDVRKNEGVPKLEFEKLCRARAASIAKLVVGTGGDPFKNCVESEQRALDALQAAWKDIPQAYKAACVHPQYYSPSYAEWIACLEMRIDVKRMRSEQ